MHIYYILCYLFAISRKDNCACHVLPLDNLDIYIFTELAL